MLGLSGFGGQNRPIAVDHLIDADSVLAGGQTAVLVAGTDDGEFPLIIGYPDRPFTRGTGLRDELDRSVLNRPILGLDQTFDFDAVQPITAATDESDGKEANRDQRQTTHPMIPPAITFEQKSK